MDPESQHTQHEVEAREDQPLLKGPDEVSWRPPRGFVLIELAIMANVFLYGLDSTITAATYGVISSEFNAANTASWLTTSYLVTSTSTSFVAGIVILRRGGARSERERYCQSAVASMNRVEKAVAIGINCFMFIEFKG